MDAHNDESSPAAPAGDVSYGEINNRFTYHPPGPAAIAAHQQVREAGRHLAYLFVDLLPTCDEKRRAIDAIDDAVKHANAAIARHGPIPASPPPTPPVAPPAGKPLPAG